MWIPVTGWGDWCDEYLTVYPDGVAARELVHWCSRLDRRHTYEQDNFIIPIGMTPAEVLEKEAITLANLDGDESKLDWAQTGLPEGRNIENASILKYNIKSAAKPFMILHPEMAKVAMEGNGKPWPHCFFWWNHWPVSTIPSDGKQIYMVDGRPSSTCVSGNTYTTNHALNERTENSLRQIWLLGMTTDRSAGDLAPLARSWSRPPDISVESDGVTREKILARPALLRTGLQGTGRAADRNGDRRQQGIAGGEHPARVQELRRFGGGVGTGWKAGAARQGLPLQSRGNPGRGEPVRLDPAGIDETRALEVDPEVTMKNKHNT